MPYEPPSLPIIIYEEFLQFIRKVKARNDPIVRRWLKSIDEDQKTE